MEELNIFYLTDTLLHPKIEDRAKRPPYDFGVTCSTEIGKFHRQGGGFVFDAGGKKNVSCVILPPKYLTNKTTLDTLSKSIDLPVDVREALVDFDKEVDRNTSGMIDFLNNMWHKDHNYFLHYDDIHNAYWKLLDKEYFEGRFVPLKPKADVVTQRTRKALGLK
jgi:hypothetical protein